MIESCCATEQYCRKLDQFGSSQNGTSAHELSRPMHTRQGNCAPGATAMAVTPGLEARTTAFADGQDCASGSGASLG